uniref:Uncharacterized protein n=1 Tax=Lactuca sativa TaxID=4236 RepID=A0A9R1V897_LACSA|nr:hypothetical protein LSAT_V11C600313660 [Lactuca sativa]
MAGIHNIGAKLLKVQGIKLQEKRSIFLLWKEIVGKQLLQDAADQGQLDAIFVLGMMLMAASSEKKQEAQIMLNNAYINMMRMLESETNLDKEI